MFLVFAYKDTFVLREVLAAVLHAYFPCFLPKAALLLFALFLFLIILSTFLSSLLYWAQRTFLQFVVPFTAGNLFTSLLIYTVGTLSFAACAPLATSNFRAFSFVWNVLAKKSTSTGRCPMVPETMRSRFVAVAVGFMHFADLANLRSTQHAHVIPVPSSCAI